MTWTPPRDLPVPDDVERAAKALAAIPGAIHHTPVIRSRILDELYGKQVFLKAENLQKVGAFKARGATYAVSRIDPKERARGIITYSSGNHAQAVAHAARIFGCKADVFMPVDAPAAKQASRGRALWGPRHVGWHDQRRPETGGDGRVEADGRTGRRAVR
jgi:threonine dehydratase